MSDSMLMMYVSFGGMALLLLAMALIMLSRTKLRGFLKAITALLAYFSLAAGALIILFVVLSGPTG